VERMDKADVKKLSDRLESFAPDSTVPAELQARAQQIADGYPRLLEALDKMLKNTTENDSAAILAAMSGEKQEFLAKVLAAKLLEQQEPELQQMLARGAMFELPVPLVVLQSICTDLAGFARHVDRSKALGLLETGLSADLVRVPQVLDLEPAADLNELAAIGVKVLHREWIENAKSSNEAQRLEIHRLAMLGGDGEIAVDMAKRLSNSWIAISRYRAARNICEETLVLQTDGGLVYNLSRIYQTLGDLQKALDYAQQSIEIDREIGNRQGEAASLHQLSMIYKSLGDLNQALKLSQDSIEINREIGNREGEAASLHQLSMIYKSLGDLNQALKFSQDSIEICREIGTRKGEAASLANMAVIAYKQGDANRVKELFLQAAEVLGSIGDYAGLITVFGNLGTNDEPDEIGYLAQSLWLTLYCSTNLEDSINLIVAIYNKVSSGDKLESLLGATACHLCQTRSHPELEQLIERSNKIIRRVASQQGIEIQADYDNWKSTNRLDDPDYFVPELLGRLESIVGDGWLFDKSVFLKENRSGTSD
jgi:tetratricopeptide (TPR) repeat protein